jgi:SNF2 family DNA or RNA helicase
MSVYDALVSNWWRSDVAACPHEDWDSNQCRTCGEFRLYPFQVEGAEFIDQTGGRCGLFHEMGLGKAVMAAAWIWHHPEARVALVTKSAIKRQIAREVKRWTSLDAQVIEGSYDQLDPAARVYVLSYGLLVPVKRYVRGVPSFSGFNLDKLRAARVNTLILDECQAISNVTSKTSKTARVLARDCAHLIALSGTPWKNKGGELWPICNLLDPGRFPSYQYFLDTEVDYYFQGGFQKQGGLRHPQEFRAKTAHIFLRRELSEVMRELPPLTRTSLACELDAKEWADYHEAEDVFAVAWDHIPTGPLATNQRRSQLLKLRHACGRAKVRAAVEFVTEFLESTERKIICFVQHLDVGETLHNELTKLCLKRTWPLPLRYLAALSSAERDRVVAAFNTTGARVLVCSTLAGGEGLNLQAACSDCLFLERQWNPANEEQAEHRILRIGQRALSVRSTYLHVPGTVDGYSHDLVEVKRHQYHAAMNRGEMPVWREDVLVQAIGDMVVAAQRRRHGTLKRPDPISQSVPARL